MTQRSFDHSFVVNKARVADNKVYCEITDLTHTAWYEFSCRFSQGKFIFEFPRLPKPPGLFPLCTHSGLDIQYAENETWLNFNLFLRDCFLRKPVNMPQTFFLYEPF